ncbi:hypothetical protein GC173_00645 [bacterium]|nr:hypothetical protein [bacterium]
MRFGFLYRFWAFVAAWGLFASMAMAQSGNLMSSEGPSLPTTPAPAPEGPFSGTRTARSFGDEAIITSEESFYTEKDGTVAYASSRTRVEYNEFVLEADRMVIDFVSEDIQAEGNVLFTGPNEYIRAERGRFNLGRAQGVAFGVNGQASDLYFAVGWNEEDRGPSFRQINEQESVFRGVKFTTNSFPKPMYYVQAREAILVRKERFFLKSATLYIRDVPALWLPIYSRNIKEGSPWFNTFGYDTDLGAFFRLGYRYIHRVRTPSFQNPSVYETRTHGLLDVYGDVMTERGEGAGATYRYKFDYGRHLGYLQVYGVRDRQRDVVGEVEENADRWAYRHKHNSMLGESLLFQYDADLSSDPDVYVDVLDRFLPDASFRRGRLFEQGSQVALTYRDDDGIGRIDMRQRYRLGRDRYTDYAEPGADDLDFDPDPEFTRSGKDFHGISGDRYGKTSERVSGRYSTRLLNLGGAPLYYRFEANAFRALDSGFNTGDEDDDTTIDGVDVYASLTHRARLGRRTTWTNTVGAGASVFDRNEEQLIPQSDFNNGTLQADGSRQVDTLRFLSPYEVMLGQSQTVIDSRDVENHYLYADYTSRLNHRFTDFLDGYLQYKIRQGTDDSLGEFYERLGRVEARTDINDFATNRHELRSGMNFYLRYPNIYASVLAGQNLQNEENLFPNEVKRFAGFNTGYKNPGNVFAMDVGAMYTERQIRAQDDPNEYVAQSIGPYVRASYYPRHARYWASLTATTNINLTEDPVNRPSREVARYDEQKDEINITPVVGRKFGPKYRVQLGGTFNTRYDVWERAGVTILRDLHDADLGLYFGVRNNSFEARRDEDERNAKQYEYETRASIRFKINRDQPGLGTRTVTTLSDLRREGYYVR